jgi:hypothetical protein
MGSVRLMASPDGDHPRDESRDNLDFRKTAHAVVGRQIGGDMISPSALEAAKQRDQRGTYCRIGATPKIKPEKQCLQWETGSFAAFNGESASRLCTEAYF